LLWLRRNKPLTYLLNLRSFLNVGSYKDLLKVATEVKKGNGEKLGAKELIELELFAEDLASDHSALEKYTAAEGDGKVVLKPHLSLAAKWAPNERSHFDKQAKLSQRLASLIFPDDKKAHMKYRKMLGPLRRHMVLVENLMCDGRWGEINFSAVPSIAHRILKKAFAKHEPERYSAYQESLAQGKAKINTTGLAPHLLVEEYYKQGTSASVDLTIEAQWKSIVDNVRKCGAFSQAVAVVDVSGSMSGIPMMVSITMGIILQELTEPPFKGRLITFQENPQWHQVEGKTLRDMVLDVRNMKWGGSTDISKVFRMIVQVGVANKVHQRDMPKILFIFSDMQFNEGIPDTSASSFEAAQQLYKQAGYKMPQVVFWNLRGDTMTFPVGEAHLKDVAMVSGFEPLLLKLFLQGESLSPLTLMKSAIKDYPGVVDDSER
jgi:Mg-chelatase subunit ChlD